MGYAPGLKDIAGRLAGRDPAPVLTPLCIWDAQLDARLRALTAASVIDGAATEAVFAQGVLSGLHLWNDNLSVAHELAMSESVPVSLAKATLDYWHGIMHRREPDYPNAKYWFRRVGAHPSFGEVLESARTVASESGLAEAHAIRRALESASAWDAFVFVDWCAAHSGSASREETVLRQIQAREMELLLAFCADRAAGA